MEFQRPGILPGKGGDVRRRRQSQHPNSSILLPLSWNIPWKMGAAHGTAAASFLNQVFTPKSPLEGFFSPLFYSSEWYFCTKHSPGFPSPPWHARCSCWEQRDPRRHPRCASPEQLQNIFLIPFLGWSNNKNKILRLSPSPNPDRTWKKPAIFVTISSPNTERRNWNCAGFAIPSLEMY